MVSSDGNWARVARMIYLVEAWMDRWRSGMFKRADGDASFYLVAMHVLPIIELGDGDLHVEATLLLIA